jgi:hypothetical protein
MAVEVNHAFVSAKGDGPDATRVQPSNWNEDHVITGLGDAAEKDVGTTAGTVAAGDDSRFKTVGTTAGTVAAGDDSRITGAAQKASNLSDLANAATAFGNIKQVATSSATGVVELATDAEAITGTDTARALTPANGLAAFERLGKLRGVNAQTADYSLLAADAGKVVEMTAATSKTVTIPANATTAIDNDCYFTVVSGQSDVVVDAAGGVTLNGVVSGSFTIPAWGSATFYKKATNTWVAPNQEVA